MTRRHHPRVLLKAYDVALATCVVFEGRHRIDTLRRFIALIVHIGLVAGTGWTRRL